MSHKAILIGGCALLLLLLVAAGGVGYVVGRPFAGGGGGQSRPAPNGKWVAHARTLSERSVVGGARRFSELRIDAGGSSGRVVRRMLIEDTAEPAMDWRIEGEVFWARNSSAVTFKCVTGKANLEVTLTP